MLIRFKGIEHNVFGDAPFVGARISSIGCSNNCQGCHSDHLREAPIKEVDVYDLVAHVSNNKFDEGIILGGLEWTEQPEEMTALINVALEAELKVMLYTHLDYWQLLMLFPHLRDSGITCKFGPYMDFIKDDNYYSCGIKLATVNQYVREI